MEHARKEPLTVSYGYRPAKADPHKAFYQEPAKKRGSEIANATISDPRLSGCPSGKACGGSRLCIS